MSLRSPALRALRAITALVTLTIGAVTMAAPSDPLDARAATQPLQHRSAFDGYRRFADEQPINWRDANDTVKRIGGWRSYAREAAPGAPAPAAPGASAPAAPGTAPARAPAHKH